MPDLVVTGADGDYLAMDSLGLLAVLVGAIQQQQLELDALNALLASR